MTLFSLLLWLYKRLHLVDEEQYIELMQSVEVFEKNMHKQDASQVHKLYAKLHKGPYFKLLAPLATIWAKRQLDDYLNGSTPERGRYTDID